MLLYRKKVGKLKGLTYAEVHKIITNLPDGIRAEYKERIFGNPKTPGTGAVRYNMTLYRKAKHEK